MFCGRQQILEDVCEYLGEKRQEILVLHGQSGCGKTSIMAQTAKLVCVLLTFCNLFFIT